MCVYSAIVDSVYDNWMEKWQTAKSSPPSPTVVHIPPTYSPADSLTQQEVDALRRLLEEAKRYDEATKQKDCEQERKKEMLRKLAEQLGVTIDLP